MSNSNFGSEEISFNILNDTDFARWVQPILVHVLFYGRVPSPSPDPVIRVIFHQVMERMIRGSLNTLLKYLTNRTSLAILYTIRAVDDRRAVFEHIRETWPEVVTHGLVKYGWSTPALMAEQQAAVQAAWVQIRAQAAAAQVPTQSFRPLQTYNLTRARDVARNEASVAEALEDFERLTLQEVQSTLEETDKSALHQVQLTLCFRSKEGAATSGNIDESDAWNDIL